MTRVASAGYRGLHVLADDDPRWQRDPVEQALAACRAGAAVVQLRAKRSGDARALAWAREIRALTRSHGVRFAVNDRFDLALAADADAVHLGQDDLPPDAIPEQALERLAVGRSTHTVAEARAACREPVDYIAFGPVFGSSSKADALAPRGLAALREVARIAGGRPLVAIGGIDAGNLARVARAGASGFAVISAAAGAADPIQAVRELVAASARARCETQAR